MPVAKLTGSSALDSMKAGDGNESLEAILPQGKEPLISYPRTGDNPVQLIQLLHALDQPELPGWPLLTPLKVQMQKCEKCSREFCSLINYRRHIRVHRRSLNVDKESHKIRDVLAAFWDKLSVEEAKEVVSFRDATLKEISGSSVIKELASSLRKPGVWTLPQVYVKAGSTLLDIIYAKPSRLPISSQELLSVLDDASERTFLCAGMAESLQKYVFDGEAGKIALELKNVIASAGFLFEQKLVKAWLAEKDAEALRCQKLLVEEEEAAQKRLAELLERKRQKKLRQKEQKAREQLNGEKVASIISVDSLEASLLEEASSPAPASDSNSDAPDVLNDISLEPVQLSNNELNHVIEAQFDLSSDHWNSGTVQNVEPAIISVDPHPWQMPKSQRVGRNGFHGYQNLQILKLDPVQKHVPARERGSVVSSNKVWAKKIKEENVEESLRPRLKEAVNQTDEMKCELLIGSISVPVGNCISRKREIIFGDAESNYSTETGKNKRNNLIDEPANSNNLQCGVSQVAAKLWRPVNRHERKGSLPVERVDHDSEEGAQLEKLKDRTAPDGSRLQLSDSDDRNSQSRDCSLYDGTTLPSGLQFSTVAAKAFLSERWKEAISAEHVKLELPAEHEPPERNQTQNDFSAPATLASNSHVSSINVASENREVDESNFSLGGKKSKARTRKNPEKGVKIKYVPRQKVVA